MPVNRDYHDPNPNFEKIWGREVASGGFLQLPHDFYRNSEKLGLTTTDSMVIIYILGQESGSYIAASSIAESLGLSVGTVRKTFRKLDRLELMHRHFQKGSASRFSYSGLKATIKVYAKIRQTQYQNIRIGIYKNESETISDLYTNKEELITNKKDGVGHKQLLDTMEKIREKKRSGI